MKLVTINGTGPTVSVRKVLNRITVISFLILGNALISFLKDESSGKKYEQTKYMCDAPSFCRPLGMGIEICHTIISGADVC